MATQSTDNLLDIMAYFDRVAAQIEQTFSQLIEQLIGRKEVLLRKVLQLKENLQSKETAKREAIQELEKTQEQLTQLSLKANLSIPIHQQANHAYDQVMKELATPTSLPFLSFSYPTRDRLVELIGTFGKLSQKINYLDKSCPILTAGKKGKGDGEFDGARGIALDEVNQIIYIVDMYNSRVQIFTFQAEFVSKFGDDLLGEPWGITLTKDHIFITDISLHSLLRYDKQTLQLIDRVGGKGSERGKLNCPSGLAVDTNGDVYIADCENNRVSIYSIVQLQFRSYFGKGKLDHPQDIKLTEESVVVLDWGGKCVYFFTRNGDLISSCATPEMKQKSFVYFPLFFFLDEDSNIIISDFYNHNIKIISRTGKLIHIIGGRGNGRGKFEYPYGLAMSDAGTVYVVSLNPLYTLQAF